MQMQRSFKQLKFSLFFTSIAVALLGALALPAHALRPVQELRLPSGQRVLLVENHNQPIVTLDTWVGTGSVNETAENNGVSHFLEHLLFKGTDKLAPRELERRLDGQGALFNAATSQDFTHYYITLPSSYLRQGLNLHANMLQRAVIPVSELNQERAVVQEEINRSEGQPMAQLFERLDKLLFEGHGYGQTTLGPKSIIASLPREHILAYYRHWYQPGQFVTVVSGDITPEETKVLVAEAFANNTPLPEAQVLAAKAVGEKTASHAKEKPEIPVLPAYTAPVVKPVVPWGKPLVQLSTQKGISQVYGVLAFPAPKLSDPLEPTLRLDAAMSAWGGDSSSRLVQRLQQEKQLVQSISAGNSTQRYAGLLYVLFTCEPKQFEPTVAELLKEWQQFKNEGLDAATWERIKRQFKNDFVFLSEDGEKLANTLGYYASIGRVQDVTQYLETLDKQSLESVNAELKKALSTQSVALAALLPEELPVSTPSAKPEAAPSLDAIQQRLQAALQKTVQKTLETSQTGAAQSAAVSTPSTEAAAKAVVPLAYQAKKQRLSNGLLLLSKPQPEQATFSMQVFVPGGLWQEAKPGLNTLLAQTWLASTKRYNEAEWQELLNRQGVKLDVSATDTLIQLSLEGTEEDLGEALLLLEEGLLNPAFEPAIVEREKKRLLHALKTSKDQPGNQALLTLKEAMYPPEHPYGKVGSRLEASLPALTVDDLKQAHQQLLERSPQWVVSVAGHYNAALLAQSLQALKLPKPTINEPFNWQAVTAQAPALTGTGYVDRPLRPEQPATWVAWGWRVPGLESKDAATLRVINGLLGNGMSSRLFVELREKQGLAYSVSSAYPLRVHDSDFVITLGSDASKEREVVRGLKQEIKRITTSLAPAEELERVKQKLIGQYRLAHNSPSQLAFYAGFYEALGLEAEDAKGYEYEAQFENLISKVSAADVLRVASKYLTASPTRIYVGPNEKPTGKRSRK